MSESVFKNLKGNFSITSPKDPNQKIGSIELEILNFFDREISSYVQRAETKFEQGELQEQVQDYVGLSDSAIRNHIQLQSSQEDTQQLTIKPQEQEMFKTRIAASLVENNNSYDPLNYSQDRFYQVQQANVQQRQQKQDQYINLKQSLLKDKEQLKQINQNAINNENVINNKKGGQMQQQQQQIKQKKQELGNNQDINAGGRIQEVLKQQQQNNLEQGISLSEWQKNNITKDMTNQNDNAFILSSENSMQKQPYGVTQQIIQTGETEKVNKEMVQKLDKLVNIGEQIFTKYLQSNEQQQQRIKDEQAKSLIQQQKLQLKTQKIQLLEKQQQQLLQQQEIESKNKQKENMEFIQSIQNNNARLQQSTRNTKQKFPLNQQIFSKTQIKIKIYDFSCSDPNFCSKITQKNIYLQTILPNALNTNESVNNDPGMLKAVCKNVLDTKFTFNSEINQQISIQLENIQELLNQQIEFQIKAYSIPKNTIEIDKGNDLVHLLAKSTLNFQEFIAKSKNFAGLFHIEMKSKFLSEIKGEKQSSQNKQVIIKKENLKPIEKNEEQVVGILRVAIQLQQIDSQQNQSIYQQHQKTQRNEAQQTYMNMQHHQTFITKCPSVSFQILFSLSQLELYSPNAKLFGKKIYAQFKVYGTQETIKTNQVEIKQDTSIDLDTELIIPCQREIIIKMKKVPFTIEVWLKDNNEQKDEILGIINLNLSRIGNNVLNKQNNYNENWCNGETNSHMMIILSNQNQEFHSLANKKVQGQIFTTLIFGSVSQIKQFKDIQQQNKISQYPLNNNKLVEQNQDDLKQERKIYPSISVNNKVGDDKNNFMEFIENEVGDVRKQIDNFKDDQEIEYPQKLQQISKGTRQQHKSTSNYQDKIKEELKKFEIPKDNVKPLHTELILIEIFETLRMNDVKIKNRMREFINSLRPPDNFVKSFELLTFLKSLPIKWKSDYILVEFCSIFDTKHVGYFQSEVFTKSYSAFVFDEEQIRNALTSHILILKQLLIANRITNTEFEHTLINNSQFGLCTVEQLNTTLMSLQIAGLEQHFIINIINYLPKDNDDADHILINVGQLIDYLKQIETYSHLRHLQTADQQLFRDQIIKNLKREIEVNRIQIGVISEEKTQNYIEIDVNTMRQIFSQVGIEISFWECYCILNEIIELSGQNTNDKVSVLQFNSYFLELEKTILNNNQTKQPFSNIQDNDSDIRDLNIFLNKSLIKNNSDQIKNPNESKEGQERQEMKEQSEQVDEGEQMISYQIKMSAASVTQLKIDESLDGTIVYLRYLLPMPEQSWIDSGVLEIYANHENYFRIALSGSHKIDIKSREDIMNVFNASEIQVEMRDAKENTLIARAVLDVNYLFDSFNSLDTNHDFRISTLPLIDSNDIQIGNINFKIEFKKEIQKLANKRQYEDILQQKEQQLQKLLPKSGYIVLNASIQNLDEECIIQLAIFKDDSFLNHLFKPISCPNKIENQSYFITISQEILKYFEEYQGSVQIFDSKGEILLGEHEFNLVNILINQQITENVTLLNSVNKQSFDILLQIDYKKNASH